MHRIVIVGGGAGGLELATRLGNTLGRRKKAHITLVDKSPTHVWKPLLHEVAAGSLDPSMHQLEYAAQAHWRSFHFEEGELIGLDRKGKTVKLAAVLDRDEENAIFLPERQLPYDTLVLALGSTTHFFGVPGAEQHAISLDTVLQAERFRRRLLRMGMRKKAEQNGLGKAPVNVVIIGAGATGVELSAELRNTGKVLREYGLHSKGTGSDINITLVEAGTRVLPALSERLSGATRRLLESLDITVSTGDQVVEVCKDEVLTRAGRRIPADITVWTAGIKAPDILSSLDGMSVNRLNQIKVLSTLQSETDPEVYAIGDCASCPRDEKNFVPPRAQAAHQQATFLVKALDVRIRTAYLPTFKYRDLGSLVSLGSSSAVGNLMGGLIGGSLFIEGVLARIMYASLYRMHIVALSGVRAMVLNTLAHQLRRIFMPRVKLH